MVKEWFKAQSLPALGFIGLSVVLAISTAWVSSLAHPNRLAAGILQGLAILAGVVGSFIVGRDTARAAAKDLVRPHARSAFRRVLNLYGALGRQRQAINVERQALEYAGAADGVVSIAQVAASFRALELMVVEQISTADDAMEDWRDLVPEEVEAVEAAGREREREIGDGDR